MVFPFLIFGLSAGAVAAVSAIAGLFGIGSGAATLRYRGTPGARARRTAKRHRKALHRELSRQRGLLARLRRKIRRAAAKTRTAAVDRRLQETPVEALKPRLETRVRWSALEAAGVASIGDLRARSAEELIAIDGIAEKSATDLARAAAEWQGEQLDSPLQAPAADLATPGSQAVARHAIQLSRARDKLAGMPAQLEERLDRIDEQADDARRAGGFWSWLFRRDGWNEATERWQQVETTAREASDELVTVAKQRHDDARRTARARIKRDEIEAVYRQDYAGLATEIERAANEKEERETQRRATGADRPETEGLDASLVDEVERTRLRAEGLSVGLRRYQEFGAKFILAQERTILGDEMGLGKTVQTLAAMSQLWSGRGRALFVVIAPASILLNWQREVEAKTFLPVTVAHGRDKEETVREWMRTGGVLVMSYATLRTYPLHEPVAELGRPIDLLVADEAHYVKNPEAGRSLAVSQLVGQSDRVVFLTGTPMENHPREFAELIRRLEPRVKIPVSPDDFEAAHVRTTAKRFREVVAPVYLRRNQDDVLLELPDRLEVEEWVGLTGEQRDAYSEAVADRSFMKMRQVVSLSPDDDAPSAKLQRLDELLTEHAEEGRKVLVFSYFLGVLAEISARHPNVGTISGSVPSPKRWEMIDEFAATDGHAVLLAQITAAGQGLNLQAASVVILVEPQLTPAIEAQAIARAHRMGQTQRVIVHRLLAADTVDQRLVEILAEKESLFDAYARESVAKEENPEATEAKLVSRIIEMEKERLGAESGAA